MSFSPRLSAQATGGRSLSETALYSLYATRHAATIALANLAVTRAADGEVRKAAENLDRKSTRLNSSHGYISYAVFCLKKKKTSHRNNSSRPFRTRISLGRPP